MIKKGYSLRRNVGRFKGHILSSLDEVIVVLVTNEGRLINRLGPLN